MPPNPPPAETDDLDALFNDYTSVFDKPLSPPPARPPSPPSRTTNPTLGLDAPLTLPTRAPRPKLDEARLLSARGIPSLRARARTLRLKGKGHEYGDAERLMGLYQLWLDDLYPKAKFGDALGMVEKVGHRKAVAVARRGWIEEGRPGRGGEDGGEGAGAGVGVRVEGGGQMQREGTARIAPIFTTLTSRSAEQRKTPDTPAPADIPDDDDLDAMAELYTASPRAAKPGAEAQPQTSIFGPRAAIPLLNPAAAAAGPEEEEEDDLAALLAEAEMDVVVDAPPTAAARTTTTREELEGEDEFDDEMDAMAEMGW
ncbi:chromosome segregation in meiosis-related protein [Pseudogymnoascus australis]